MKFSKVTKNQSFTLSWKKTLLEKPQGGDQIDPYITSQPLKG